MIQNDWRKLNRLNQQLCDIEDRIHQHEKRLEELRERRDLLKEEQRLLSVFNKIIPDVIRNWWQS